MKMSNNKSSNKRNTKFDNTYPLYKSIDIITRRKHYEKEKWQVIKVVTITLDLMTLAIQVQYRCILISH